MGIDVTGYLYAAGMTAGGAYQAMYNKSPRYLAYGALCGAAASLGAYQTSQNSNDVGVMMTTSSVYSVVMSMLHRETTGFLPYGPSAICSMFMVIKCLVTTTFPTRKQV